MIDYADTALVDNPIQKTTKLHGLSPTPLAINKRTMI